MFHITRNVKHFSHLPLDRLDSPAKGKRKTFIKKVTIIGLQNVPECSAKLVIVDHTANIKTGVFTSTLRMRKIHPYPNVYGLFSRQTVSSKNLFEKRFKQLNKSSTKTGFPEPNSDNIWNEQKMIG